MDDPKQPPSDGPRRSAARERQRRRKLRRQAAEQQGTRGKPQLIPAGGFEMPEIETRYLRYLVLGAGAMLFMVAIIVALGLLKNSPAAEEIDPNALWVGDEWAYEQHNDDEMRNFIERLAANHIGTVYAQVSNLNVDGTWTGNPDGTNRFSEVRANVSAFAEQFKRLHPDSQLYGVVGVRADLDTDGYRLDDEALQQTVAEFSAQVVNDFGFDGVLLDVKLVSDGDENFLDLLRAVRQSIGEDPLMAVTVPPDWTPVGANIPTPSVIAENTIWQRPYKQRVALIQVDQMVVQAYNSYLNSSVDYVEWVAYQVQAFAEAIAALETNMAVVIGIPTYENALPAHDTLVENISSALLGVQRGLERAGEASRVVQGVAIYANWDTDEVEWTQFKDNWVDQ